MPAFVETIAFIFILIGFGYLSALSGLLKPETGAGLADFVFKIALPLLLFHTLATADLRGVSPWGLWAAYFSAVAVTWVVSHQLVRRVFHRDARASVVSGISGAYSNIVLLGLPMVLGIYGRDGLAVLSLIVSIHLPVMMAAIIVLYEWASRADGVATGSGGLTALLKGFALQLLRNPLLYGIVAGALVHVSGIRMPDLAERVFGTFATIAGPIALFSMGMGMRRFGVRGQVAAGALVAAVKLMLMPALALLTAWLFGLPPMTAKIVVVTAALPAGVNSWLIAEQFGTGQRMASTAMTIGTAGSVVTSALWLAVAGAVFG